MNNILELNINEIGSLVNNKNILITGGTGSFGNKLTAVLLEHFNVNKIVIFSRDEFKQSVMQEKFPQSQYPKIRYFIGDVRDFNRLKSAFNGIDIVFHAAALKQVPAVEYNPLEAIKTNVYGTENVVNAAIEANVERVIGVSTDKCVSPVNLYGATKLCLEKIIIGGNVMSGNKTKFAVLRYGNVMSSRGSVIPLFQKQKETGVLTITDDKMTRFTLTLTEAINFVLNCSAKMMGGEIFVPKLPSYNILQLAQVIAPNAEIKVTGIRPGEKLHESMMSQYESHLAIDCTSHYVIIPTIKYYEMDKYQKHHNSMIVVGSGFEYDSFNNELISDDKLKSLIDQ